MSEYPPENPADGIAIPPAIPDNVLAVTGFDAWPLLLLAAALIAFGVWAILHVGKKSDSHHEDS